MPRLAPERWKAAAPYLDQALDLSAEERGAWLESIRRGDPALAADLEGLLEDHRRVSGEGFLEESFTPSLGASAGEGAGDTIGRYTLLAPIGEGGFGVVFLAEQREPVERRVALKIVKPGMDTREVVARFEAERQALAVMDHPGVAKVFDGGVTPAGRPYFVMEHVQGPPITEFCDLERHTLHQRVDLFVGVCLAVHHAHSKGIIHRDIKPSNVLVALTDGSPSPKVIDFGIAKAIRHERAGRTLFTEAGRLMGTPEYMSPEQAEVDPQDIDTRTDVYSLGVLLYELLVGVRPFDPQDLRRKTYAEIQRIIREVPAPTPTRRLATIETARAADIAFKRRLAPEAMKRRLRRELEWIPLKAMRKERAERYSSPEALAADLRRFLAGEPLEAGPESRAYRASKFLRRHRAAVAAVATIVAALSVGLGTALVQRNEAVRQAQRETQARRRLEAVSGFVIKSLQSSDPAQGGREGTTIAESMTSALKELDGGAFADDPETEAVLYDTIATVLLNNARQADALPLFERALAIRRRVHRGDAPELASAMNNLAVAQRLLARYAEAEALFREALSMRRRLFPDGHSDVTQALNNLAFTLADLGQQAEAEPLLRECLELEERLSGPESLATANGLNALAWTLIQSGKPAEAEPLLERSLAIHRRVRSQDHPALAQALGSVALVRQQLGRAAEAEPLARESLQVYRRVYGGDHPDLAAALQAHGSLLHDLGRTVEAESLLLQALEMRRRLYSGDHPDIAESFSSLSGVRRSLGHLSNAEAAARAAFEMYERMFPEDHPTVLTTMGNLAGVRLAMGRAAEAEPLYARVLELRRRTADGDHPGVALGLNNLAFCRIDLGRLDQAESGARESVEMYRRLFPDGHPRLAVAMSTLALVLHRRGRAAEARELIGEAETMVLRSEPAAGPLATKVLDARKRMTSAR